MSRAKKVGLNLKPPTVSHTTPGYDNSNKKILLICKQIWYVPFFWTLTWFTYWILHATIILNTPLTQLNPLDCIGAAISTAIFATALVQRSFHATTKTTVTLHPKWKNNTQKFQAKKPPKALINSQTALRSARENPEPSKLTPPGPVASAAASGANYPKQHPASQEILEECLTCENLINCRHRRGQLLDPQDQGSETARCPFAQSARAYVTVQNNISYLNRLATTT